MKPPADNTAGTGQLATLNAIGKSVTSSLNLVTVLDRVLHEMPTLIDADGVAVLIHRPPFLDFAAVSGPAAEHLQDLRMPASEGVAGHVLMTGQPEYVTGAEADRAIYRAVETSAFRTRSLIAVPLELGGETIGVLEVASGQANAYDASDLRLVEAIGQWVAIAVRNARLFGDLAEALATEQELRERLVLAGKLTATGRMVASVAHELNNPLQILGNSLFLAQERIDDPASVARFLDLARDEVRRLTGLVARLRQLYRPENADVDAVIDVARLLTDVYALAGAHLRKHGVRWRLVTAQSGIFVRGSADQLKQVFLNLCLNAVDAMLPDGGHLNVSITPQVDDTVRVDVSDTGAGIPPDQIDALFDPFYTTKTGGMGLGLSISFDIVSYHAGHIDVHSTPGQGSTFSVTLPMAQRTHPEDCDG